MDEPKDIMKQLLIKPEKCIGCRTCELVCSFGHHNEFNPKMANVKVFEYEQAAVAIPMMCLQCDEAACMKVCPVKAISGETKKPHVIDESKCIKCGHCMTLCKFDAISVE